jgi:hypothetical protein
VTSAASAPSRIWNLTDPLARYRLPYCMLCRMSDNCRHVARSTCPGAGRPQPCRGCSPRPQVSKGLHVRVETLSHDLLLFLRGDQERVELVARAIIGLPLVRP